MVFTPSRSLQRKKSIVITDQNRKRTEVEIDGPVRIQLKEMPRANYTTPQKRRGGGKSSRTSWTNIVFLRFMKLWWKYSDTPFYRENHGKRQESGAESLLQEMRHVHIV